jgi:hypothetical protein
MAQLKLLLDQAVGNSAPAPPKKANWGTTPTRVQEINGVRDLLTGLSFPPFPSSSSVSFVYSSSSLRSLCFFSLFFFFFFFFLFFFFFFFFLFL